MYEIVVIIALGLLAHCLLNWMITRSPIYYEFTLYKQEKLGKLSHCHRAWYDKDRKIVVEAYDEIGTYARVEDWAKHSNLSKKSAKILINTIEEKLRRNGFREAMPSDYIFICIELTFDKKLLSNSQDELGYLYDEFEDLLNDTFNGSVEAFNTFNERVTYIIKILNVDKAKLALIECVKENKNLGAVLSKFKVDVREN